MNRFINTRFISAFLDHADGRGNRQLATMVTKTPAHSPSTFPLNLNILPQKVSGIVSAQTPSKLPTSFCLPLVVAEVNTVLAIELSLHCQVPD